MDDKQKPKSHKAVSATNVIESLKNIGGTVSPIKEDIAGIVGGVGSSIKEDLIKKAPQAFMDQLFGPRPQSSFSGEIVPGGSLEIKDVFTGQDKEKQKLQKQVLYERRLRQEETIAINRKTNELRMQLQTVMREVLILTETTQNLGKEAKIAAMQAPIEPGVYHIIFFEKLLEFLRSFRKKIEEASVWLYASNKRAQKKNAWGANYKKHGAKYLLSGEHYLSRSAG